MPILLGGSTNDRAFYERFWSGFETPLEMQLAIHEESRRPLLNLLERVLPAEGSPRFLEVGCGTALDACLLLKRRRECKGFAADLSVEAAAVARMNARKLGLDLHVFSGDLTGLPFRDGYFDLVFSQGVMEHFRDPKPGVDEQLRVLGDGGMLVVDVPQRFNWYTAQKHRAMRQGTWPWGWETEYSLSDLKDWAGRHEMDFVGAVGHQHGRVVDRLLIHPHRMLRNKLKRRLRDETHTEYRPGAIARVWEGLWDRIDAVVGPYVAINVAVAFRKRTRNQ